MKIQAKVTSDKPAYTKKEKTDTGYVWRYDEKHIEKRWEEKKEKLDKLEKGIKKLREKYEKDLSSDDPRTRAIAAVVGLMDQTAMRVGNEESAREADTYGATTLKVKHVKISGNKVTFDFPGKGAVEQNVELEDAKVVKVLKELMENKKGDDFVFEVDGKKIWDRAINRYLSPLDISAKDLRGYRANVLMKEMLKKEKDFDKALEEVAEIVGHKASTLKNQYLDPELVEKHSKKEAALSIRAREYEQVQQSELGGPELQSIPSEEFMGGIYQPIPSEPQAQVDINRNVSNIRSKISPSGFEQVKITPNVAIAWRIIAPFLPQGAELSSGFRSPQDQANTIRNYWHEKWNGYFAKNFPNRGKTIEDMHKFMNEEYNPQAPGTPLGGPSKAAATVSSPGESKHQNDAAMDIYGINYAHADRIIQWLNKNMSDFVSFTTLQEGDHIHVSINHVTWPGPQNMMSMLQKYYNGVKPQQLYVTQSFEPALSKRALLSREDLGYFRQKMQEIGGPGATGGLALSKTQKQQMRIGPNAKPNQLILNAWRSLLPFMPPGAILTSGERTPEDQLRIIDDYWHKAGGPADYPNITDPQQKANILTNQYGYVVGGPASNKPRSHLKGNAFDISGADLDEIVEVIQTVSRYLPIKLRPQIERRNNAVHVGIESATYDAEAVAQLAQQMGTRVAMYEYHMLRKSAYEDLVDSGAPAELIEAFDPETDADERGQGTPDLPGDWFEKSPMFRHREKVPEYDIHSEDSPAQLAKDDPEAFFYRGLHKSSPDLEKGALEKMLEHNAKFYFIFNYHEREDKGFLDLLQTAAEKLSQQDARAFFYFHLHKKFPELGRGAIVQIVDTNPDSFFDLGLDKEYPDYTESANAARNIKDPNKIELELDQLEQITSGAPNPFLSKRATISADEAQQLAKANPRDFFFYSLDKTYPDLAQSAAVELAKTSPHDFFFYRLDKIYPDLSKPLAAELAKTSPSGFFAYRLHKTHPDLAQSVAIELAKTSPSSFFFYRVHKIYPDLGKPLAAEWAKTNPDDFFIYRLHRTYTEIGRSLAIELLKTNPYKFFEYGLHKTYPDLADVVPQGPLKLSSRLSKLAANVNKIRNELHDANRGGVWNIAHSDLRDSLGPFTIKYQSEVADSAQILLGSIDSKPIKTVKLTTGEELLSTLKNEANILEQKAKDAWSSAKDKILTAQSSSPDKVVSWKTLKQITSTQESVLIYMLAMLRSGDLDKDFNLFSRPPALSQQKESVSIPRMNQPGMVDRIFAIRIEQSNMAIDKAIPMSFHQLDEDSEWKDRLPGGLADKKDPKDFDPKQLQKGIETELEHVDDKQLAREIAMDHLVEDSEYYDKLEKMEKGSSLILSKQASVINVDLQKFKDKVLYKIKDLMPDTTPQDIQQNFDFIVKPTEQAAQQLANMINEATKRIPNWGNSPIVIIANTPYEGGFSEYDWWDARLEGKPITGYSVKVGGGDFTYFSDGTIDDVLDVGDEEEYFKAPTEKSDYFRLIQMLQRGSVPESDKPLRLYTARPAEDREKLLEMAKSNKWPSGIFLTNSLSFAEGFGADYGEERDIWKVIVPQSSVLYDDGGSVGHKQYQLFGGETADITSAQLLNHGKPKSAGLLFSKHAKKDKPKAGVFIVLPSNLAKQFPSLGEHDDSKPHVTVLFIGAVPKNKHDTLIDTVKEVAAKTEPFELELDDNVSYFPASKHSDDCKVAKVGVKSSDLRKLHKALKEALTEAGVDIDDHWPDYKPHVTLEYMEPPKAKYEDDVPSGSCKVKEMEIWGAGSKKTIPLGKVTKGFMSIRAKIMPRSQSTWKIPRGYNAQVAAYPREGFDINKLKVIENLPHNVELGGATGLSGNLEKPTNVIWTSTLMTDSTTDWLRWAKANEIDYGGGKAVIFDVSGANVYRVNGDAGYEGLVQKYPREVRYMGMPMGTFVDWDKVAQDYDGVHIVKPPRFSTWDVEQTLWFNAKHLKQVEIGKIVDVEVADIGAPKR